MRVIAGKFKGKNLCEFNLGTTRPTADMVREALFDKIGFDIRDKICLDLFAGTGAIGIEALSRNAKFCYFVDTEKEAIKIIKKNIEIIKAENFEILNQDFQKAIFTFKNSKIKFDIVFLDPPYKTDFAERAIVLLKENDVLNDNALVVWEHDETKLDYVKNNFAGCVTKKYGRKYLTYIYTK